MRKEGYVNRKNGCGNRGIINIVIIVFISLFGVGCVASRSSLPNIILISIDTLRADHLSCYGYGRETSPCIDSLAESGIMFTHCQAQAPHTTPAHASMLTGLSVIAHGAGYYNGVDHGLDPDLPTIPSMLKGNGYVNLAMVNSVVINPDYGFSRGFDYFSWDPNGQGRAGITVDEYLDWIDDNRGNPAPVFAFLHFYDVHIPYDPPSPYDELFTDNGSQGVTGWVTDTLSGTLLNPDDSDHLMNLYDGEIVWVDSQLKRLFDGLRERDLHERTIIILVSDHGEEFLEHGGWGHSHALWQEMLHVPLIISGPGIPRGVVDSLPCGQFDILPTIAELAGIEPEFTIEGVSLVAPVSRSSNRLIPSSRVSPDKCFRWRMEQHEGLVAVYLNGLKGIRNYGLDETGVMFDLVQDSREADSLPLSPELQNALDYYWTTPPVGNPEPMAIDSISGLLRDLGYIR